MLSPWIIGFTLFTLYPMISSFWFSLTKYDLLGEPQFAGLFNYRFMVFDDPYFWKAVANTLWMIVFGVPTKILFATLFAMLLVRPRRGIRVYRTVYFLPTMVPPVAATLGFVFLMSPRIGPINQFLERIGVAHPPLWFYDPRWSKPALLVLAVWGIGDAMIIYLAGLLDVPVQLYEAASIEGASRWQRFRHVTLPMLTPVIFFSLVTGVIDSFQYFTEAYVASAAANPGNANAIGSPLNSLLFYTSWLYQQGFQYFHMGYASAMAWGLFAITMVCTLIIVKTSKRWVFYQGGGVFG